MGPMQVTISGMSGKGALPLKAQRPLASAPLRGEGPYRRRFQSQRTAARPDEAEVAEKLPETTETTKFKQEALKTYKIPEGRLFQVVSLAFGVLARGGSGCFVAGYSVGSTKDPDDGVTYRPFKPLGFPNIIEKSTKISKFKRPEKPIEIYEFQACPFCQKVREAVCILDLDVMFYPTPRGSPHHRSKVKELGGKQLFPYMVDPNTSTSMYESNDIIAYLFREYGDGQVPLQFSLGPLTVLSCGLCSLLRLGRGSSYRPAKYPDQPLTLWGYEMSPFSRFVRERLVELELPFLQVCCARGSEKRQKLKDTVGAFQVPYLEDPNTGVALFESSEIIKYLEETYAVTT